MLLDEIEQIPGEKVIRLANNENYVDDDESDWKYELCDRP